MASKKPPQLFGIPDFGQIKSTNKNFRTNYWNAFSYAHYELANAALKKETLKYLKTIKSDNYDRAVDLNENMFTSVGKFCYIFNHGGDFIDDVEHNLNAAIGEMIDLHESAKARSKVKLVIDENEVSDKPAAPVISIQDRLREKAGEAATEIEQWIDERVLDKKLPAKDVTDFLGLFSKHSLKAAHIKHLLSFFEYDRLEIAEALAGKDDYIKEMYVNYTKSSLRHLNQFFVNLHLAAEQLCKNAAISKAPRKKKPTDINKMVAKLPFLKEDTALGLVSLSPVHIPGAQSVWIYNTKTRKLGCLQAYDSSGLAVKGSSIINISSESIEKTLRKPAETLDEFRKSSKAKLRTFLKELSTLDTNMKGRLNEHCIILRIDK